MKDPVEVILLDLGGVLLELGEEPIPSEWLPGNDRFSLDDWFSSRTAMLFEKGLICARTFADTLKNDLRIVASTEDILTHFTDWPIGLYPGTQELLITLQPIYRLALLSNSNELHWPRFVEEFDIETYFEKIFVSHKMKMAKPDPEIFQIVIDELEVEPEKILFLDDNILNVAASKKLGINGCHVKGIQQLRRVLSKAGVIGAEHSPAAG